MATDDEIAAKHKLVYEMTSNTLDIWEEGVSHKQLGPGGIQDDEFTSSFMFLQFMRGVEWGYEKGRRDERKERDRTSYEKGVSDAWADVRRRLDRA